MTPSCWALLLRINFCSQGLSRSGWWLFWWALVSWCKTGWKQLKMGDVIDLYYLLFYCRQRNTSTLSLHKAEKQVCHLHGNYCTNKTEKSLGWSQSLDIWIILLCVEVRVSKQDQIREVVFSSNMIFSKISTFLCFQLKKTSANRWKNSIYFLVVVTEDEWQFPNYFSGGVIKPNAEAGIRNTRISQWMMENVLFTDESGLRDLYQ